MSQILNISENDFNKFYPQLKNHYKFFNSKISPNLTRKEFEKNYLKSKLWRLNNIYTVINKEGEQQIFRMNYAQHLIYSESKKHARLIILKSRQQGVSTFWLVSFFDDALFCPNLNIGLMAQGTDEASMLLERTKFLWESLNQDIKKFLNIELEKNNTKEFAFTNNSTIFIRVSFRSTTLHRLHISELGKIANENPKRAKEVRTGTLPALGKNNTGVIESTAEGKNMFKNMWDSSVLVKYSGQKTPKDFHPVFLSWLDDPDCQINEQQSITEEAYKYFKNTKQNITEKQKNFWIAQRRELGDEIFQEYPATPEEAFIISRDGTYYAKQFNEEVVKKNKITKNLYDENLPLDVYFDLGVDDYTVMIFVQWYKKEWRIVDEYYNNGYALYHYLEYLEYSKYRPRALRFPHDVKIRELSVKKYGGLAKSRLEIIREWGTKNNATWRVDVLAKNSVENGIEATRIMIPNMYIENTCKYTIDCFLNYSKEWDDKLQIWKKTPLHNVYSHGADAIRLIASSTIENEKQHASKYTPRKYLNKNIGFAL